MIQNPWLSDHAKHGLNFQALSSQYLWRNSKREHFGGKLSYQAWSRTCLSSGAKLGCRGVPLLKYFRCYNAE